MIGATYALFLGAPMTQLADLTQPSNHREHRAVTYMTVMTQKHTGPEAQTIKQGETMNKVQRRGRLFAEAVFLHVWGSRELRNNV
jgi:hypothetical protein